VISFFPLHALRFYLYFCFFHFFVFFHFLVFFNFFVGLTSTNPYRPRILDFVDYLYGRELNDELLVQTKYQTLSERKKIESVLILLRFNALQPAAEIFENVTLLNKEKFLTNEGRKKLLKFRNRPGMWKNIFNRKI